MPKVSSALILTKRERIEEALPLGEVEVTVVDLDRASKGSFLLVGEVDGKDVEVEYPDLLSALWALRDFVGKHPDQRGEIRFRGKALVEVGSDTPSLLFVVLKAGMLYDLVAVAHPDQEVRSLLLEEEGVEVETEVEGRLERHPSLREGIARVLEAEKKGLRASLRLSKGGQVWVAEL